MKRLYGTLKAKPTRRTSLYPESEPGSFLLLFFTEHREEGFSVVMSQKMNSNLLKKGVREDSRQAGSRHNNRNNNITLKV